MFDDDNHLAVITPIDADDSHRVMNRMSLAMNAGKLIFIQTMWIWFATAGTWMLTSHHEMVHRLGVAAWITALILLSIQFCLVFIYPEWPVNLELCQKLRQSVLDRKDRAAWVDKEIDARVVELVPRERWRKNAMETATDLLLLHITADGVYLEGDRDRYQLPGDSILSAEFEDVRPSGWFTSTNMVVITARTAQGPIEIPIAYRDHYFGTLQNSRRREAAIELANKINLIARGAKFQAGTLAVPPLAPLPQSANPYAAPTS